MSRETFADRVVALHTRTTRLEDIAAIHDLHRTYVRRLADRDWEPMLDDFLPDAIVSLRGHGARRGRAELAELFGAMHAAGSPPDAYTLTSPEVVVDGSLAQGWWTWQRHFTELPVMGGSIRITGPWWEGRYNARYSKVDGRWMFAEMYFRLVAPVRDADANSVLAARLLPEGDR